MGCAWGHAADSAPKCAALQAAAAAAKDARCEGDGGMAAAMARRQRPLLPCLHRPCPAVHGHGHVYMQYMQCMGMAMSTPVHTVYLDQVVECLAQDAFVHVERLGHQLQTHPLLQVGRQAGFRV